MAPPMRIYPGRVGLCLGGPLELNFHSLEFIQPVLDIGSGLAFADATAIRRQTSRREIAFSVLQMP